MEFEEDGRIRCLRLSSGRVYPPDGEWGDRVYHASTLSGRHHVTDHENDPVPSTASGNRFSDICRAASSSVQNSRLAAAREEQSALFRRRQSFSLQTDRATSATRTTSRTSRGKNRRRVRSWGRDFICLGSKDQTRWTRADHSTLKIAGLGTKRITFENVDEVSSMELKDRLYKAFPKLAGQGFELLRLKVNTTVLEEIPVGSSGFTPLYLSSILQSAKIFVRPIANDLSLAPDREVSMR